MFWKLRWKTMCFKLVWIKVTAKYNKYTWITKAIYKVDKAVAGYKVKVAVAKGSTE